MPNAIRAICNSFSRDMSIPSVSDRSAFVRSESETYLSSKRPAATSASVCMLLWTLQVGLGEAFTPELRDAWASAYNMLSETRMEAATGASSTHATTNFRGRGPSRDAWVREIKPSIGALLDRKQPEALTSFNIANASVHELWQCSVAPDNPAPRLPRNASRHWHPWQHCQRCQCQRTRIGIVQSDEIVSAARASPRAGSAQERPTRPGCAAEARPGEP